MKKRGLIIAGILFVAAGIYFVVAKRSQFVAPAKAGAQVEEPGSAAADDVQDFLSQLEPPSHSQRTLDLPLPLPPQPDDLAVQKPQTPEQKARAQGRKKRAGLPLGVLLWDDVPIYKEKTGHEPLYTMSAGDFVKVYGDADDGRWHVHPGVDVYLAATSKEIETAGNRFPDVAGWVEKSKLHVFQPERAKEFTQSAEPITLGSGDFSTVDFYERAFKNPDPVVHRVIGPRLMALLSLHEDYSSAWGRLYRDPDEKIRALALATLRERGVGKSAPLIEDLITRVVELKKAGRPENDPETALVVTILKGSKSPRAENALKSLSE